MSGTVLELKFAGAAVLLGVSERTVMGIMGESITAMAARCEHVTDPIRRPVVDQVGGLLWADSRAWTAASGTRT